MAQPIEVDFVYDEDGQPHVPAEAVDRMRDQIGHTPQPGETIHALVIVGPDERPQLDEAFEQWARTEGVAAYDALRADPSRAIPAADISDYFDTLYAERTASRP